MLFSLRSKWQLLKAALFKRSPVYVQFYVTARCNLRCLQCNIIHANAGLPECSIEDVRAIAENLRVLGVPMVLLTGGEPFARQDLPEIIGEFESRGIHVRMQTNGLAGEEAIRRAVAAGGRDISISLDTLRPELQDDINGGREGSWRRAVRAMSLFTQCLPAKDSFASIGCVLHRRNIEDIEGVIRFASAVGWHTSLVPVHVTSPDRPLGFRTTDEGQRFRPEDFARVAEVVERVREMRREGFLLYDSDAYLDDIKRFVRGEPVEWRVRNGGVCDSPNLYFVIRPNGDFAPCCDHAMSRSIPVQSPDFPTLYRDAGFRREVLEITRACAGCLYGSFPEITVSMRYLKPKLRRARLFLAPSPKRPWPVSEERMVEIAERLRGGEAPGEAP